MNTLIPKSNPKSRERVDPPVPPGAATANMGKDLRSRVGAARGMLTFAPFPFFFYSRGRSRGRRRFPFYTFFVRRRLAME